MRLIRTLCWIALITGLAHEAHAQPVLPKPPTRFGLVLGLNRADFEGEDTQGSKPRTGVLLGATLFIPITPAVAFQPELLFSQKGSRIEDPSGDGTINTNYIEMPLLFRADVPVQGAVRPFAFLGPAVGVRLSCDLGFSSGGQSETFTCDEFADLIGDPDIKFNRIDYGILFGGGIGFSLGGQAVSVGARYNYGMGQIANDGDSKHRVLSLVGTIEFPFGRR